MLRAFLLLLSVGVPAFAADPVSFARTAESVAVSVGDEPFTTFHFGSAATKPYLHPLRAPDGTVVTRSYPMESVEGEQTDHPHHRGVWFSHGEVNGVDFWANEPTQRSGHPKGRIALKEIGPIQTGEAAGRIYASFLWKGPGGEVLLEERRAMTFSRQGADNAVDFDIVLEAVADSVHFGDTKEGTFAVRMATELEEPHYRAEGIKRTGRILNAEGRATEAAAWGKRSPWVDYAGSVEGKPLGVAIFDHPSNPKHPTYWHVRGYGLFAANVFGEHDFHADESRDGSLTLAKGETLRFRYRILVHEGATADADVRGKYEAWAASARD